MDAYYCQEVKSKKADNNVQKSAVVQLFKNKQKLIFKRC